MGPPRDPDAPRRDFEEAGDHARLRQLPDGEADAVESAGRVPRDVAVPCDAGRLRGEMPAPIRAHEGRQNSQITIWAVLFRLLGEFDDMVKAIYHSGVNFAGLGYGDIVMPESRRLLGPLEAANGVLMFGVSTAVMTGAVIDILKQMSSRASGDDCP